MPDSCFFDSRMVIRFPRADSHSSRDAVALAPTASGEETARLTAHSSPIPTRRRKREEEASFAVVMPSRHCTPNTKISGEPPFWPWLVRCNSLLGGPFLTLEVSARDSSGLHGEAVWLLTDDVGYRAPGPTKACTGGRER